MTSEEFAAVATELGLALGAAGLVVEAAEMAAGNVSRWVPIAPEQIFGCWMQHGWRIRRVPRDVARARVLKLVPRPDAGS